MNGAIRRVIFLSLAAAWCLAAGLSAAGGGSAQSLFDEGRRLIRAGDYAAACPKFAESQRLQPAPGTLLNLARCHELEGRLATALGEFQQVRSEAQSSHRKDRQQAAEERIAALEKRVPRLTVNVSASSRATGLRITIDGAELADSSWGTDAPMDPGEHTVEARAEGRTSFTRTVLLGQGEHLLVDVPELRPILAPARPVASSQPQHQVPDSQRGRGRTATGWVIGGAGLVAIGVGTFFGIRAIGSNNDSKSLCSTGCDAEGARLSRQAVREARVADAAIALGLAGLGIGGYLLLTPKHVTSDGAASRPALRVNATASGADVTFATSW